MSEILSMFEHAVRRLRFLRCSGEPSEEQKRIAKLYERNLGIDWRKIIKEAAKTGPTEGGPHSIALKQKDS